MLTEHREYVASTNVRPMIVEDKTKRTSREGLVTLVILSNLGAWEHAADKKVVVVVRRKAPTRHLGANIGYALNHNVLTCENYTMLSKTKCRVGAKQKWQFKPAT